METFDIYVTFTGGDRMKETHSESELLEALTRLTRGPAAAGGLIREVKVVDALDCTCFLSEFDDERGCHRVVFPPQPPQAA
jgi:hypothetical protein